MRTIPLARGGRIIISDDGGRVTVEPGHGTDVDVEIEHVAMHTDERQALIDGLEMLGRADPTRADLARGLIRRLRA